MRYIISAGGTGGHIMPALAIAEGIRERIPDAQILFVGTHRGMEERLSTKAGLEFKALRSLGIKGKSLPDILKAILVNIGAFIKALKIARDFRPDWVIGTGGYVTGMVVLAGYLSGAGCAIQEQNSTPGLTNILLSRIASRVFLAFPDTTGRFPANRTVITGNPIRKGLIGKGTADKAAHLVILGGSLGAGSINRAGLEAVKILKKDGITIPVMHQTGKADLDWVSRAYEDSGISAQVHGFIEDMASVYINGRLAVCRCGGLTLSELSAAGLPAVMIPFPLATDDHQMKNAMYVESNGGGWIIPETDLNAERLATEIKTRFFDRDELKRASSRMKDMGIGNGSEIIAGEITGV